MNNRISIHEGLTYEYLVPGLFVLFGGGILLFFTSIGGFLVITVGFLLMVVSTGIEVDITQKRLRKYKSILFVRFGVWESLTNIITVELRYNANSVKIKGAFTQPMIAFPVLLPNPGGAAKTFDLYLVDDVGEEKLINQFLKISLAIKTLKVLAQIPNLKIVNHFDKMMTTQRTNRR